MESNSLAFVNPSSFRAVAMIGAFVVRSRYLVNAKPIPLDAGVTSTQGFMAGVW